jgi:hypothetical protein
MVIVMVAVLAMTAAVEHKASAWGILKIGAGFNMTLAGGPSKVWMQQPIPYPQCFGGLLDGYGLQGGYPAPVYPYAATANQSPIPAAAASNAPAAQPVPAPRPSAQSYYASPWGAEYQPVYYRFWP